MNRPSRMAALALACAGLTSAAPAAAPAPTEAGWTSLFDGKTAEGWTSIPLKEGAATKWEVKDGLLCGSGEASMLFSPKGNYKNFRYRAELKVNDGGNSGMYVRTKKAASFTGGYEVQVNSTHKDPIKTGSLYTHVHIFKSPAKADTFFTQEVEVIDKPFRDKVVTQITIKVDGEVLYTFNDFDQTWKEGHFAFQQHDPGSKVTIRKVEVMELP